MSIYIYKIPQNSNKSDNILVIHFRNSFTLSFLFKSVKKFNGFWTYPTLGSPTIPILILVLSLPISMGGSSTGCFFFGGIWDVGDSPLVLVTKKNFKCECFQRISQSKQRIDFSYIFIPPTNYINRYFNNLPRPLVSLWCEHQQRGELNRQIQSK